MMDPEILAIRRARAVAALGPLFVTSGATSLIYETLWSRQLHLVFGTSQLAIVTVLAAFMAGLAGGGLLAARFVNRVASPLRAYAALEAFIGAYALLFPLLARGTEPIYTAFFQATTPGPTLFGAFQFLLLGLLLLPPTICMGATLPLLARFAVSGGSEAGRQVGRLYGANTAGAVLGTALAGFVLLPQFGLWTTTVLAALGNFALAGAAIWVSQDADPLAISTRREEGPRRDGPALWILAGLAGLASLTYEVAWFRVLALNLGASAYAFTVMLLGFLVGIGAGGWLGGRWADAVFARGGTRGVLLRLVGLELAVGGLAWATMFAYGELPFAYVSLFTAVEKSLVLLWPATLLLALAVMLPATLCMGVAFPFLVRAAVGADEADGSAGGPVGRLYGANTLGSIIGAAAGGFVLLPELHVTGTVLLAIVVNLAAAVLALALAEGMRPTRRLLGGGALAAGLALAVHLWPPPWNPLLMTAAMYKYVTDLADRSREGIIRFSTGNYDLLFYDEGLSSVVTVGQNRETKNIWLANNGKVEASSTSDMPTQVLVAHLPFAFRPRADRVGVIGLASGITAGSVTTQPAPRRIDLVELEPAIVQASHAYDAVNHTPLNDPRVRLHINDGRNHLVLAEDGSYDILISEPSNPWITGVSNLFTAEFFALGKRKLKPDGVWSQWVQMYGMDYRDLMSLLRTFASTYKNVRLFSTIEDSDLVLVGSDGPLDLSLSDFDGMIAMDPAVAADLAQIEIVAGADLLSYFRMDGERILKISEQIPLNTDDNMRIEYSAPLHLYDDSAEDNLLLLLHPNGEGAWVPLEAVHTADEHFALASAYSRHEDWLRALLVLKPATEKWPEDARIAQLFSENQAKLLKRIQAR